MKKVNKIIAKISTVLPVLALMVGIIAANSACVSYYNQPETPSAMDAYRK